jgi:hypothetical protein
MAADDPAELERPDRSGCWKTPAWMLGLLLVLCAAAWVRVSWGVMPQASERLMVAALLRTERRFVRFQGQTPSLSRGTVRGWVGGDPALGGVGEVSTHNSRVARVRFMDRPRVQVDGRISPPLRLDLDSSDDVVRVRIAGEQKQMGSVTPSTRDLAIAATAAVLGLTARDELDARLEPELRWEGAAAPSKQRPQSVEVDLAFDGRRRDVPRRVRVTIIPETRQVVQLRVIRW